MTILSILVIAVLLPAASVGGGLVALGIVGLVLKGRHGRAWHEHAPKVLPKA
jgi:hypothetical protein